MTTESTLRVFQGTATASDDGWANDAYYSLTRGGIEAREGVDGCTSWEECSGRDGGEEYVTIRTTAPVAAIERLASLGYRAEVIEMTVAGSGSVGIDLS